MPSTVLLVDDNRMFLEIQKEFLEYSNVEILTASDGLEALAVAQAQRPDLIFMDLHMPKMDGSSCCRALKSVSALVNIPVVMVTSKGSEEDKDLCYTAGCDHFLTKPLDRDMFLDVARKFIPSIDRRERRILANFACTLKLQDESVTCRLHDLAVGGVFVVTDSIVVPNSVVQIAFNLPDGTEIACHGRVAWVNRIYAKFPRGIGIKFALMPKEMQQSLKFFVDSQRELF